MAPVYIQTSGVRLNGPWIMDVSDVISGARPVGISVMILIVTSAVNGCIISLFNKQ